MQYGSVGAKETLCKQDVFVKHECPHLKKIVAAFRGMHVSPAKHSSASVTDGQTDDGQSDPYVSLCFAATQKVQKPFLE